jgi:hypothetical protein
MARSFERAVFIFGAISQCRFLLAANDSTGGGE